MVFKEREKWNSVATTRVWQLKGMKRKADKGRRPLCLVEEGVIDIVWKLETTERHF